MPLSARFYNAILELAATLKCSTKHNMGKFALIEDVQMSGQWPDLKAIGLKLKIDPNPIAYPSFE